jgi:uncharacterized repeat protein (TIGR03803 family)
LTVLHAFSSSEGGSPSGLIQATDGDFYGSMTSDGGVFRMTATGTLTLLHRFVSPMTVVGNLVQATDGNLYGMTNCYATEVGPAVIFHPGTVFQLTTTGTLTVLHEFKVDGSEGLCPDAGLIQATDGDLYGTASGAAFKITTTGTLTVLHALGDLVVAPLVQAADGNLYGTSYSSSGQVTVFRLSPSGTVTALNAFHSDPYDVSGLLQAADGNLYGTTRDEGASSFGTVFQITTTGSLTVIHEFGSGGDGRSPSWLAALVQGSDGNLWGTTELGGDFNKGTIFTTTLTGTEAVVHSFDEGLEGRSPSAALVQVADGSLFGTTSTGGGSDCDCGTVFKLTPTGTFTSMHAFGGGQEVGGPSGALTQATDGNLYGTTNQGGGDRAYANAGMAYQITPSGALTVLHKFLSPDTTDTSEGGPPGGALIQAADGNLYGTTLYGGPMQGGTVFKLTTTGALSVFYAFGASSNGGAARVIQAADGNFYGTTATPCCPGTVFKLTTTGTLTLLHVFGGSTEVGLPSGLVQATDGNLYGTLTGGWGLMHGAVFKITTTGTFSFLYVFSGGADGARPQAGLIQASDGNLYGTTSVGGAYGYGTVFQLTPSGALTVFHAFTGGSDGATPLAELMQAADGNVYGTTFAGGANGNGDGVVFRIRLAVSTGGDFDGDGKADPTVYRAASHQWWLLYSRTDYATNSGPVEWGVSGDVPVAGDYDGDGKTDPAVYRPSTGTWYVLQSSSHYTTGVAYLWGISGDLPEPGDYDGDGKTDPAVYRPSTGTWYVLKSSSNYTSGVAYWWGISADVPVPGDYDGDGKTDPAVFRPSTGTWFVLESSANYTTTLSLRWGGLGETPVPADYDGDGQTDPAVYIPSSGEWWILYSSTNYTTNSGPIQWGGGDAIPVPGDYDGDGRADPAVYFPSDSQWWMLYSSTGYTTNSGAVVWGLPGDTPIRPIQ